MTTNLPKILVVDDNAENRALAQATLEEEDYAVVLASSGEEALSAFERDQPDCVLLDVRMPGMTGFVVCEKNPRAAARARDADRVFDGATRRGHLRRGVASRR
ncbi:MAG: response regulator [Polyangiaceae bacterium]